MLDNQIECHACVLHSLVVTPWNNYLNISKCSPRRDTHYFAATHPHAFPRTLSRVLFSLARQIACRGVNRLSCQREACLSLTHVSSSVGGRQRTYQHLIRSRCQTFYACFIYTMFNWLLLLSMLKLIHIYLLTYIIKVASLFLLTCTYIVIGP